MIKKENVLIVTHIIMHQEIEKHVLKINVILIKKYCRKMAHAKHVKLTRGHRNKVIFGSVAPTHANLQSTSISKVNALGVVRTLVILANCEDVLLINVRKIRRC